MAPGVRLTTSRTWPVPGSTAAERSKGVPSMTMERNASRVPEASSRLTTWMARSGPPTSLQLVIWPA